MSGLADLFPGFAGHEIETSGARIFARTGGSGPPLLLLHGYPQTHVMWHKAAPALAEHFSLVIADLRGYGQSSCPEAEEDRSTYSKRAMALDCVEAMAALGHETFMLAGHDRGGRAGYRLALDHPDRLTKLAVLDIIPTHAMWHGFSVEMAMKVYHWLFLAQPEPLPEMLIGKAPVEYLDYTMGKWTGPDGVSIFAPEAMAHYYDFFSQPERLHATCEDYRSGQTFDLAADEADVAAGRKIACPVLALWGTRGIPSGGGGEGPLAVWRKWADTVEGAGIDAGHFIAEEKPDETAAALIRFFRD